ncbi:hypothetical protein ElyMa_003779900 [Elysia marginata]|uniref:Uncharacterized protein n=1 Tax=Elysia marginata TaxID=1093978 RepID=A0AAV4FAI3_9GAST|nr:hypothetical protein ElyMa_003779900 [Elysia marginata]
MTLIKLDTATPLQIELRTGLHLDYRESVTNSSGSNNIRTFIVERQRRKSGSLERKCREPGTLRGASRLGGCGVIDTSLIRTDLWSSPYHSHSAQD